MASFLYTPYRKALLDGNAPAFLTGDIRVQLIDSGTYAALATHEFLSSVPAASRIGAAVALATKTSADGVADADDTVITAVTGATVEALIIYLNTGVDTTAKLMAYIDQGPNWPLTPNGGNVTVVWPNDANRIFKV